MREDSNGPAPNLPVRNKVMLLNNDEKILALVFLIEKEPVSRMTSKKRESSQRLRCKNCTKGRVVL